jgi:hypothetical protein
MVIDKDVSKPGFWLDAGSGDDAVAALIAAIRHDMRKERA